MRVLKRCPTPLEDADGPMEPGFAAQLNDLKRKAHTIDPKYRALFLLLLLSIPVPFLIVGLSVAGFSDEGWSGPTAYAGIAGLAAFLVWAAVRTPRWILRHLNELPEIVAAMEGFSPRTVSVERDWQRHPVVRGTLPEGGLAIPVELEFRPAAWEAISPADLFPRLIVHTPWNRPDDLLVGNWLFFSTFEAFHPLETWAFRKDLWRELAEGLYSNWSLSRLEVRLYQGKRESLQDYARRVAAAFDAFRIAVRLSRESPGALSFRLVEEQRRVQLPIVFGFYRLANCDEGHVVSHANWDAPRCPKCGGPLTKKIARSGLDWKNPKEQLRRLRRFADEANPEASSPIRSQR